jgi:farnesyl diphosphate synthase
MIDIRAETEQFDISVVTRMHRMKTGALISYAVEICTILKEVEDHVRRALEGFAHDLGLAYQITDDLLDATGNQDEMGKAAGKDAGQGKATFVTILGIEGAKERSRHLAAQAKEHLDPFGARADVLREAVDFIVARRS